jgi:hypothetical protein
MNVIVTWIEVPEEADFVIFRNISEPDFRRLLSYHGKFINSEDCPEDMNDFFFKADGKFRFEKHAGPVRNWSFDANLIMGFVL